MAFFRGIYPSVAIISNKRQPKGGSRGLFCVTVGVDAVCSVRKSEQQEECEAAGV